MNADAELLNYIHQNAEMGVEVIEQLMKIIENSTEDFLNILEAQYNEYKEISKLSKNMLDEKSEEIKDLSIFTKASSYLTINFRTLRDKSTSHIAEMMIPGSTMGIVDIMKKLKDYDSASESVRALGERLLRFEENNVEELKKHL